MSAKPENERVEFTDLREANEHRQRESGGAEPVAWTFEYLCDNGVDEPTWEPGASVLNPSKWTAFQHRNIQPAFAAPPAPAEAQARVEALEIARGIEASGERLMVSTRYDAATRELFEAMKNDAARIAALLSGSTPKPAGVDLPAPCYLMSEPHLSGYRVILGYETLDQSMDAQTSLAKHFKEAGR